MLLFLYFYYIFGRNHRASFPLMKGARGMFSFAFFFSYYFLIIYNKENIPLKSPFKRGSRADGKAFDQLMQELISINTLDSVVTLSEDSCQSPLAE